MPKYGTKINKWLESSLFYGAVVGIMGLSLLSKSQVRQAELQVPNCKWSPQTSTSYIPATCWISEIYPELSVHGGKASQWVLERWRYRPSRQMPTVTFLSTELCIWYAGTYSGSPLDWTAILECLKIRYAMWKQFCTFSFHQSRFSRIMNGSLKPNKCAVSQTSDNTRAIAVLVTCTSLWWLLALCSLNKSVETNGFPGIIQSAMAILNSSA